MSTNLSDVPTSSTSLSDVRKSRRRSQAWVAAQMGVPQSSVARIEWRQNMRISTLRRFVEALGGRLLITADIPGVGTIEVTSGDGTIEVTPVAEVAPPKPVLLNKLQANRKRK